MAEIGEVAGEQHGPAEALVAERAEQPPGRLGAVETRLEDGHGQPGQVGAAMGHPVTFTIELGVF
ncbi:hypothetical protein [Streptosporangium vulgare]|uniref:hypothetical protein n=1 Tax=Streptosporangium vulgare TaxID=46190 RepID=UPI0031DB723E